MNTQDSTSQSATDERFVPSPLPLRGSRGAWQRHWSALAPHFNDPIQPARGFVYPEMGDEVLALRDMTIQVLGACAAVTLHRGESGIVLDGSRHPGRFADVRTHIGLVVFFESAAAVYPHGFTISWADAARKKNFALRHPRDIGHNRLSPHCVRTKKGGFNMNAAPTRTQVREIKGLINILFANNRAQIKTFMAKPQGGETPRQMLRTQIAATRLRARVLKTMHGHF